MKFLLSCGKGESLFLDNIVLLIAYENNALVFFLKLWDKVTTVRNPVFHLLIFAEIKKK